MYVYCYSIMTVCSIQPNIMQGIFTLSKSISSLPILWHISMPVRHSIWSSIAIIHKLHSKLHNPVNYSNNGVDNADYIDTCARYNSIHTCTNVHTYIHVHTYMYVWVWSHTNTQTQKVSICTYKYLQEHCT